MRRPGLILMVGLLLTAGGVGLGWLAAELRLADDIVIDGAIGAEAPHDPAPQLADAGPAKALPAAATPLRVATERTGALESEIARLRWQLASRRRTCLPEPPAEEPDEPEVAAADGPRSLIANPERTVAEAPEPQPAVAPPAMTPAREPAPPPPVVAAAEPPALPEVPPAVPAAPPAPGYRPGEALSGPEAAIQRGDLGFLQGCWVSSPFSNPVNGVASTKVYCFDGAGNGRMDYRGQDGVTCSAPIRARWEAGRRLVLEEPQDGFCSNFGPWYREATTCTIGADGRAQCSSYEFHRRFNYGTRLTRS